MARDEAEGPDEGRFRRPADGDLALDPSDFRGVAGGARNSAEVQPVLGQVHARPVRKSNVRVSKPKTPRARTPSTLALRRGGQNSKQYLQAGLTHWLISALRPTTTSGRSAAARAII